MATTKNKISVLIPEQLPDFIKSDHPDFVGFIKKYYEFLESAELKLKTLGNNDSILTEEGSTTYILLEDDNFYRKGESNTIILEDYNQTWVGGAAIGAPTEETPVGSDTLTAASRERTAGSFINGETITGQTSKATAVIRAEDINHNSRLFISSQNKFIIDEQIVGATSNASAYIESYTANPVQNISDLMEYADIDDTIDIFFEQFKEAFMRTIPRKLATDITITDEAGVTRLATLDERNILKNIKDLYRAKGTRKGHEIFFRILLGESVDLFYPTENIFRISDGTWADDTTLRVVQVNDALLLENDENDQLYLLMENGEHIEQEGSTLLTHDISKLVGETITQDAARDLTIEEGQPHHPDTVGYAGPAGGYSTLGKATATVESVSQIQLGPVVLYDLTLTEGSLSGTFLPGQRIYGQDNTNANRTILAKNTSMLSSISPSISGQYFSTGDTLTATSDIGIGAQVSIDAVTYGKVSNIEISDIGSGYEIGDVLSVSNSGTSGTGLAAEVALVNGSFAPETGSLTNEFRITLENEVGELLTEDTTTTYFTQEENYGMVSTDHFILEDYTVASDNKPGRKFVQELGDGIGDITDVRVTAIGNNYSSLPALTLPTTKTLRVRASRILAEDEDNILFETGAKMMLEENVALTQTTFAYTTTGGHIQETTNTLGNFTVGEVIDATAPSTASGTVVRHYPDPEIPDHNYIEYTEIDSTIVAGDTVTGATSGNNAVVLSVTNRSGGKVIAKGAGTVGKVAAAKVIEPGIHYTETPALTTVTNILVTGASADLLANKIITGGTSGATALIKSYDSGSQLIKVTSVTGTFQADEVITESDTGTTATINSVDSVTFTSNIGATGVFGKYINEDGFISEDSKKIQDSYYYQDFSYVVKTATSITIWKDSLLSSVHPSGFALFSQIDPVNTLNLRIKTSSTVPDLADARDSFTPDLLSTLKTIFTTQLGRRLGGTAQTVSSAPLVGVPAGTPLSNDKDVSITHHIILDRNLRQTRARKGSGESIIYPTVTIPASSGDSHFIGDGGWIRKNINRYMFADSERRSVDSSTTFRGHTGFYDKRELTTLNEGGTLSNSDTTITLTSAAQFPTSGTIVIEDEQITYTGKSGNDLTGCTRGANSTTAATHADGTNVYNYKFCATQNTGTSGSYHPAQWSEFTLEQITDFPGAKHNIPAPSEITISVT